MKNIEYKPTNCPSDLTDVQWEKIRAFFLERNKSSSHKRSIAEAVLYLVKTSCQWSLPRHEYPKWSTVKPFYYRAVANGIWEKAMQYLVKEPRVNAGRNENPSYALIDSQSVKTAAGADNRGYDGVKKTKGRKRHIVTRPVPKPT